MFPKNYLQDRLVLLLLSINSFFAVIGTILILLRLGSGRGGSYIVEYRANLGISAYSAGKVTDILAFVLFLILVFGMNTLLSVKVYQHHRNYSITVLGLGALLMLLAIIVSNALLVLR
jgi:hypothetical protein